MFASLLIANRGEIACRIARTARAMGIRTIAVYSAADRAALHVSMADEAVAIGPSAARDSYLRHDAILAAAKHTGAEAIHPGYGFLSENAAFAEACEAAGIIFVGPPSDAIRAMGLKDGAKALMEKAGVPVVPGYHGDRQEPAFLKEKAYETGYPVLLKAVAGGGGKGMRRIDKAKDFDAALESVRREADNAFGDPRVLVEKFIQNPRHVEIQVFADSHGKAVHLYERDCSAQRRHQKVIEEAPAPGMTDAVRAAMGTAAVDAAQAVGYRGAGTVEFIADGSAGLRSDGFWFMEMNTRLQVEHPVTEMITGLDLVEWQIRVAAGEPLPLDQDSIPLQGHAVEARVYAEDPETGFLPSIGRLDVFRPAGTIDGLRVDTGVVEGDIISPFYDPMIAKLIAHGPDRETAVQRLYDALVESRIAGPKTNTGFLVALLGHDAVRTGGFDTGLIDREFADYAAVDLPTGLVERAIMALSEPAETTDHAGSWQDPWDHLSAFSLSGPARVGRTFEIAGALVEVQLVWTAEGLSVSIPDRGDAAKFEVDPQAALIRVGRDVFVFHKGQAVPIRVPDPLDRVAEAEGGEGTMTAPMTGKVVALSVEVGDAVEPGSALFAVEAMKMEHAVQAPIGGTVIAVHGAVGDQVREGAVIVEIGLAEAGEEAPTDTDFEPD